MMDYCNEIQSFINYTTPNLRNISGGSIRWARCMNKKFFNPDVVTMHLLQKGFLEEYMCWYIHMENNLFLTRPW
jgi:hypothetical protein